jgi:hypothetical protein
MTGTLVNNPMWEIFIYHPQQVKAGNGSMEQRSPVAPTLNKLFSSLRYLLATFKFVYEEGLQLIHLIGDFDR